MMSLYRAVRWFVGLGLEFYFIDVQTTGLESIPRDGPVIFAANHPNSIMDTVVLTTQVPRPISYLARSGLFEIPVFGRLYRKLGAIPIYRAQDSQGDSSAMARNESMFRKVYEVLERDGVIGIFPEGQNSEERQVLDLRTGAARMALGAEAQNAYSLGVRVVPVGLIFEDRDRFLSRVLVRFGTPIRVASFEREHREDERAAVRSLTNLIQERMREEAVHIQDARSIDLVRDIHDVYGQKLLDNMVVQSPSKDRGLLRGILHEIQSSRGDRGSLEDEFWVKQRIADVVAWYNVREPSLVIRVQRDLQRYKDHLEQVRLRDELLDTSASNVSRRREAVKMTLYAFFFAPFAALGCLANIVQVLLVLAAVRFVPSEAIRAITAFGTGLIVFPAMYTTQWWLAHTHIGLGWSWLAVWAFFAPVMGFFFLRYVWVLLRYRDRILLRTLFQTNRVQIRVLLREREQLIERLEAIRKRYLSESEAERDAEEHAEERARAIHRAEQVVSSESG